MSTSILTVTLNPAIDRVVEVEALEPNEHIEARTMLRVAGGKGVNVARVLAALNTPCAAAGFLGRRNAALFEDTFAELDIEDAFVRIDGYTRENLTIVERQGRRETHLRDEGSAVEASHWTQLRAVVFDWLDRQGESATVAVCGSLPPGVTVDDVVDLLAEIRRRGARVVLDAAGELLIRAVEQGGLWLIKPNLAELAELADLVGRPISETDFSAAVDLLGGVEQILLSAGADGATLISTAGMIGAKVALPTDVVVRNTVGCGDTLLATDLAASQHGVAPTDGLRSAVATATAAAAHPATAEFDPSLARGLESEIEMCV